MINNPIRQLQIPNLINKDILEDIIFNDNMKILFEYEFDELSINILRLEIYDFLNNNPSKYSFPPTLKYIETKTPLNIIKDTLESKIIDAIENNTFRLLDNHITINEKNTVVIDCNIEKIKKQ